jgi:hypothetical protein
MGEDAELETVALRGRFHLRTASFFRRVVGLNRRVAESIQKELELLEKTGRVTASGHRPVHAEFGFEEIKRDADPAAVAAGTNDLAANLDNAWSRLKRSINPE